MNEATAAEILRVSFPVDSEVLKKAYRQMAFELHPDRTRGDDAPFKELTAAYNYVKDNSHYLVLSPEGPQDSAYTVDGTPLCELGLGLGPTVNGRPCERCHGAGHVASNQPVWKPCITCQSGRVDLHHAFPRFYRPGSFRPCFICHGAGGRMISVPSGSRLFCTNCKGTGEIKLYNPVLPKGALAALSGRR